MENALSQEQSDRQCGARIVTWVLFGHGRDNLNRMQTRGGVKTSRSSSGTGELGVGIA